MSYNRHYASRSDASSSSTEIDGASRLQWKEPLQSFSSNSSRTFRSGSGGFAAGPSGAVHRTSDHQAVRCDSSRCPRESSCGLRRQSERRGSDAEDTETCESGRWRSLSAAERTAAKHGPTPRRESSRGPYPAAGDVRRTSRQGESDNEDTETCDDGRWRSLSATERTTAMNRRSSHRQSSRGSSRRESSFGYPVMEVHAGPRREVMDLEECYNARKASGDWRRTARIEAVAGRRSFSRRESSRGSTRESSYGSRRSRPMEEDDVSPRPLQRRDSASSKASIPVQDPFNSSIKTEAKRVVYIDIDTDNRAELESIAWKFKEDGAVIANIEPDAPKDWSIRVGDRLISINGQDISRLAQKSIAELWSSAQDKGARWMRVGVLPFARSLIGA